MDLLYHVRDTLQFHLCAVAPIGRVSALMFDNCNADPVWLGLSEILRSSPKSGHHLLMRNGLDLSFFHLLISIPRQSHDCGVIHWRGGCGWVFEAFPKRAGQERPFLRREAQRFGSNLINAHTQKLHANQSEGKPLFYFHAGDLKATPPTNSASPGQYQLERLPSAALLEPRAWAKSSSLPHIC
jgi:hypothetical protein